MMYRKLRFSGLIVFVVMGVTLCPSIDAGIFHKPICVRDPMDETSKIYVQKVIEFPCPRCGEVLKGDTSDVGTEASCPICHHKFTVPESR